MILGTPFLSLLLPFSVTQEGITSKINGNPVFLKFSTKPKWVPEDESILALAQEGSSSSESDTEETSRFFWAHRSLQERYEMGDPIVEPLGPEAGYCAYGMSNPDFLYKKIKVPSPRYHQNQDSKAILDLKNELNRVRLLQIHTEILDQLTFLSMNRASKRTKVDTPSSWAGASSPASSQSKEAYKRKSQKTVIIIEDQDANKHPNELAAQYLMFHLHPITIPKSREWFEAILTDTESATFNHRMRSTVQIAFSSIKVEKVLSLKDWGKKPLQRNAFKNTAINPRTYNYFDYIEAWEQVLYYQNTQSAHSWFITLKTGDTPIKEDFPNWFKDWFGLFGPIPAIFPEAALGGFEFFFKKNFAEIPNREDSLLLFIALYEIPWILKWTYTVIKDSEDKLPRLGRCFHVKWWDNFNSNHLSKKNINLILFKEAKASSSKDKPPDVSQILKTLTQGQRLLPKEKEKLIQFLEESDEEMKNPSPNDEDYNLKYGGDFSQDPYDL